MIKLNHLIVIAALGLAIGACKDNQKASGGRAGGEILPGSTSDAMLPLDTVRSQAPLAPRGGKPEDRASDAATPGKSKAKPAGDAAMEAPAAPASPEPVEADPVASAPD